MIINRSIVTILLLLGGLGISFFFTWPDIKEVRVKTAELKKLRTELGYANEHYQKLEELSERLKQYQPVLAKIDSALPSNLSMPAFLNYYQVITAQNGLVASGLGMPSITAPAESGIKDIKLGLSVMGSYESLKNLLRSLYRNSKLIEVDGVSFSSPREGNLYDFRMETRTHSY